MPDKFDRFHNRTEVANYLHISRMELWRFEQYLSLTRHKNDHISWLSVTDIDTWWNKVFKLRYGRPAVVEKGT